MDRTEVFQAASAPCLKYQVLDQKFKTTAFKDAFSFSSLLQDARSGLSHSERN